jgi:hypothetical protein
MISIDKETLIELILKSEPDFLAQAELAINGFGSVRKLTAQEDVWIWHKDRVKAIDDHTLNYLILKIVE